jgi:capsular polysaccharide biosynthesis protein
LARGHRPSPPLAQVEIVGGDIQMDGLVRSKPIAAPRSVTIATTLFGRGTSVPVARNISFGAQILREFENAWLLPPHGMVRVGNQLVEDTFHLAPVHYPAFCPAIHAVECNRALIVPTDSAQVVETACHIGSNANYYHFLMEDLPRLRHLAASPEYASAPILVDRAAAPWQIELLALFGVGRERLLSVDLTKPLLVRRLILPPRASRNLATHPDDVTFVRATLLGDAPFAIRTGKRLYISRDGLGGRALLNSRAVEAAFQRAGYLTVRPERFSVKAQVELFRDAEAIAGPGGAGLTNIIFAPADARVIALAAEDVLNETFTSMTQAIGQDYASCVGAAAARPHKAWIWSRFNFEIDLDDLDRCLTA